MPQTVPDSVDTAKSKPGRGPGLQGSCVAPRGRGCCRHADGAQEGFLGEGPEGLSWPGLGECQELGGETGQKQLRLKDPVSCWKRTWQRTKVSKQPGVQRDEWHVA